MTVDLLLHERNKYLLRAAGSSMADVAKACGVRQSTVTVVSQGYRRARKIESEIARRRGTSAEQLFPDRYHTQTERLS